MTPLEKEILVGILTLRDRLGALPLHLAEPRARPGILAAKKGLVATAYAPWIRHGDAGRQATSRAYRKLEAAGLLVRHGDAGKTCQLSLTTEGESLARRLAAPRAARRKAAAESPTDG